MVDGAPRVPRSVAARRPLGRLYGRCHHPGRTRAAHSAGFSSVTFYALLVVVGSVIYRAVEALQAPGYDWGVLRAWRAPRYALDALPILAFGFQASPGAVL